MLSGRRSLKDNSLPMLPQQVARASRLAHNATSRRH